MPGKRNRKDSERSTSSSTTASLSSAPDLSSGSGTGSCSSDSVDGESEEMSLKTCCFPAGCPQGEDTVTDESLMVKMICNFDGCTTSQFMHVECFTHWEEGILGYLRSHGRARSWSEKQRRQNLWTKRGYDLAYRACMCKCKHGHLRKDLDWIPQPSAGSSGDADALLNAKKKNRKKHKDLPALGAAKFANMANRTKSKPIPDNKDARMRHNSTSSAVSVDQGYSSASPSTTEISPYLFSPPSHHHSRPMFSFHASQMPQNRAPNGFHAPSTSPLPEIPDEMVLPSPTSINTSPPGAFSPPLSPDMPSCSYPVRDIDMHEIQRVFPKAAENSRPCTESDIQAMTQLIDNLWRCGKQPTNQRADINATPTPSIPITQKPDFFQRFPSNQQLSDPLFRYRQADSSSAPLPYPTDPRSYPPSHPTIPPSYQQLNIGSLPGQPLLPSSPTEHDAWRSVVMSCRRDVASAQDQSYGVLRQREQKDAEKREMNKYILSMMNADDNKTQVITIPNEKFSGTPSHTEIRLVPMRSTTFTKRYDFSAFKNVLPRQHINPYRIKMEGEGYGSDDLRNLILASLSVVKCSQMNCVVCGTDMPIYDHFPLVDGTMFLSPECNERTEKNCFKIKVEGKHEFVHAACMRCLEGLHTIVCRMCDARWEGTHHQLGTLYMYDIFAANPCCQRRLCCKHCGGVVVDIRQGLKFYSDYSKQQMCQSCGRNDYHFIHPTSSYQLMGLVLS